MILMIDNYDSFTYNLAQLLQMLGEEVHIFRNDQIAVAQMTALAPKAVVFSPGPGTPREAGVCVEAVQKLAGRIPLFGVCLGHQSMGAAFGGRIVRAGRIMHGKTSAIFHDGQGLFGSVPNPFEATRYHSLIIEAGSLPFCLKVSAWTAEGEIMGVRHREYLLEGVQFHPESILTDAGKQIMGNFLTMVRKQKKEENKTRKENY
jgi:anthranilate synthase/aminodeoxychorismate synthase-like glutamine amidotransferase